MKKIVLAVGFVAIVSLPSCMHPAERVLDAREASAPCLLDAQGRISRGACDAYGRFTAANAVGLTMSSQTTPSRLVANDTLAH